MKGGRFIKLETYNSELCSSLKRMDKENAYQVLTKDEGISDSDIQGVTSEGDSNDPLIDLIVEVIHAKSNNPDDVKILILN